jgi:AraC-like DNA-binding protein
MGLAAERPVTGVVLDAELVPEDVGLKAAVEEFTVRFPSLWLVLVARSGTDPWGLFRLGRAGLGNLVLTHLDEVHAGVARAIRTGFGLSTEALVTRAVSAHLPASETLAVRLALRGAQLGWRTDELAARAGVTRAHLSVRLKASGLPSAGHLLVWAKLLHAGRWLGNPGRTGESVSRQWEYSSGAGFRRALRNYTGATPVEIREAGGLEPVLDAFLATCGLGRHQPRGLFVV